MKPGEVLKAKESLDPLYRKGDKFRVLKLEANPDMMPISAVSIYTGEVYGFEEWELQ